RIYVNHIKIYLDKNTSDSDFVLINATVSQRRENLICKGSIDFSASRFNNLIFKPLLFYKFTQKINAYLQLAFMGDDLLINNVVISSDNIKISGAGIVYNLTSTPFVDLKLITMPLNLKDLVNLESKIIVNGLLNIVAGLKGGAGGLQLETQMLMSKSEFYLPSKLVRLSNVFCNIYFKNNEIIIKDLNALINYRFPVSLQGKISNFANPEFICRIESFQTRKTDAIIQETSSIVLDIEARLDGENFKGSADFGMMLEKKLPNYLKRNEIKTTLRKVSAPFIKNQIAPFNIMLNAEEVFVSNRQILNDNPLYGYDWKMDNLTSKFMIKPEGPLSIEMQGSVYQGKVEGRGEWDLANSRSSSYFLLKFIDLEASNFSGLLPVPTIISGKLNGVLYLTNEDLGGVITVAKGAVSKLNLIDNIADFLGIKSIKELRDIFLMVDFLANRSSIKVKKFNLRSPALDLVSSFTINDKEWITGTASLSLSKETLEESDILRRLIGMVGETNKRIGFDFRVSGFSRALRVELLEGEFRNRLLAGLGSGIRSQIETEIDKAVSSFRDKNTVR
ncbi:MAG: hypothetical protein Q8N14_05690, partial [Candidatus Omnitrophota bacterium]|nr:hypothetical protein [Candidatus Omnitrophota bacterium]